MDGCKYYKQKKQVSYDNGVTWSDVTPAEYRKGNLYESESIDCGHIHDYSKDYLTFIALENGDIQFMKEPYTAGNIYYSVNNGYNWTSGNSQGTATIFVSEGDRVLFKGFDWPAGQYIGHFESDTQFNVEGNILSLDYGDDFANYTSTSGGSSHFSYIFADRVSGNNRWPGLRSLVSAEHLVLPTTNVPNRCFEGMFEGRSLLTTAPSILSAITISSYCFERMFYGCTSLTTVPDLPATTLSQGCYTLMFYGCTSLTTAPQISATTLAYGCCQNMFASCTGLTTAPSILPATTLAELCYNNMFAGCKSLTTAPVLPATTLSQGCYSYMFQGCTSLTTAPVLPATTLAAYCYEGMFDMAKRYPDSDGCYSSALNTIECWAINKTANDCLKNWVKCVGQSGTFKKLPISISTDWTTGDNGIPTGWNTQDITARWTTIGNICVGCDEYIEQKVQLSYDSGSTWIDTDLVSATTLVEHNSVDCGYNSKWIARYSDGTENSGQCDSTSAITFGEVSKYNLVNLGIGNCTKTIESGIFSGCSSLKYVTIGDNVSYIYRRTFGSCENLEKVTIGSGVTNIGMAAFSGCSSMTSVVIPNSVTYIDNNAFDECTGLLSITCLSTTPPKLNPYAFDDTNNCPIYVPSGSVSKYKSASGWRTYSSRIQAIPA